MRYWDSSALIPLLVEEPRSPELREILKSDPSLISWWGTPIECFSALWRRKRESLFTEKDFQEILERLGKLTQEIDLVAPTTALRERTLRLISLHPLRSANALQLAAALRWSQEQTRGVSLVCIDERLCQAALAEGFSVLPLKK